MISIDLSGRLIYKLLVLKNVNIFSDGGMFFMWKVLFLLFLQLKYTCWCFAQIINQHYNYLMTEIECGIKLQSAERFCEILLDV